MINEKLDRLKEKAELFLKENTRVFIIDIYNEYYFCDILIVGENHLYIQHFKGKKKLEKERLMWLDIIRLDEYEEREVKE